MSNKAIISWLGSGGNHLRWLLLLDDQFVYDIEGCSDKVSFLMDKVYSSDRIWQNWLGYEWRWRNTMDQHIAFSHAKGEFKTNTTYCGLVTDPDVALHHYLKFNSNLNNTSISSFKTQVLKHNYWLESRAPAGNLIIINSNELFTSNLDRGLYTKVIDWFNLADNYNKAAIIHSRWWKLHKKAEQDFVQYIRKIYDDKPI